jgi:hypothetical protein
VPAALAIICCDRPSDAASRQLRNPRFHQLKSGKTLQTESALFAAGRRDAVR